MATKLVQDTSLTSVANAIRVKAEISGTLEFPDGFVSAIQNLSPSGNDYVVTLSWDTQDEMWTIDKTYAEAYAAYQAGKTLTTNVDATDFSDGIVVGSKIWFDNDFNHFWLDITWESDTEVFGGGKRQVYGLSSLDGYYFAETHDILLYPQFESPSRTYTPTTSTQTETITYDASDDYNGIDHVSVTVNPIPSQYIVPSGTKTITENGTYDVTNFASADVNVSGGGGGASNFVTGTFTPQAGTDGVNTISVPYAGTGYPILVAVAVEGGIRNANVTDWYDLIQRYAIGYWVAIRNVLSDSLSAQATVLDVHKSSETNATSYISAQSTAGNVFSNNSNPTSSTSQVYKAITVSSPTEIKIYVNSTGAGLVPNITYRYFIVYSSQA